MKTLTIKVPDELAARLAKRAQRCGLTKSAVAREAISRELAGEAPEHVEEEATAYNLLKGGLGCVATGLGDLSTNPRHMKGFGK